MNNEIKKGNLNYDQSGRAYPDNPQIKENWDCIWEKDGKHYKLVGDNEHKEWEEIENQYKVISKEQNARILEDLLEYLKEQHSNLPTHVFEVLGEVIDDLKIIESYE